MAAGVALSNDEDDIRNFWIGAVGIREDGVLVSSRNGPVFSTEVDNYQLVPTSHAEGRLLRKLGKYGTIYVARLKPGTRELGMSAPCPMCQVRIKSYKVDKVYYSINDDQYGVWDVNKDIHKIFG
jgi:tRNA(Arg) A34 adenosine deaminase TadA